MHDYILPKQEYTLLKEYYPWHLVDIQYMVPLSDFYKWHNFQFAYPMTKTLLLSIFSLQILVLMMVLMLILLLVLLLVLSVQLLKKIGKVSIKKNSRYINKFKVYKHTINVHAILIVSHISWLCICVKCVRVG